MNEGRDECEGWKWAVTSGEISYSQMNALVLGGISVYNKAHCRDSLDPQFYHKIEMDNSSTSVTVCIFCTGIYSELCKGSGIFAHVYDGGRVRSR